MISWKCKFFDELSNNELYKILQLRNEVFIVEQKCAYQDLDNKDFFAYHLCAWENEKLLAYTRLFDLGKSYPEVASIGRVITSPAYRRKNLGKELMTRSTEEIYRLFGNVPIKISAQLYLKRFYESFGFVKQGEVYLEDGIDHIAMLKSS